MSDYNQPDATEEIEWVQQEIDANTLRTELQRLKRRAQKRKLLLLLLCLTGSLLVLRKISNKIPIYTATIILQATEGDIVGERVPLARSGLANYLYNVALNKDRLLPIVEQFDLSPDRESKGDLYAVGELRNTLNIEVAANYFNQMRLTGDSQRRATIAIQFSDPDPDLAFDVAQALSAALVEAEQARRAEITKILNTAAAYGAQAAENKLLILKKKLATSLLRLDSTGDETDEALYRISELRLGDQIDAAEDVLWTFNASRDQTALAISAESADQGLRFEVIDVKPPAIVPKKTLVAYTLVGLFVFLLLVPVCSISVAALDTRLHHIEDLIRLNVSVVGHVPGFPGGNMGSMNERMNAKRKS